MFYSTKADLKLFGSFLLIVCRQPLVAMGQLISLAQHLFPRSTRSIPRAPWRLRSSESGSVMVEFAVSFSFIIFLCRGGVSLGSVLDGYLKLTQVTDEAVRIISAFPGLDETPVSWADFRENQNQTLESCVTNPRGNRVCGHLLMQARAVFLARTMGINVDDEEFNITSRYNLNQDTVHVEISGAGIGILFFFGRLPVSIEATGPYLY